MAGEQQRLDFIIERRGFNTARTIQYMLLKNLTSIKNFKDINNNGKINIKNTDKFLVIRYRCDDPDAKIPDGFQIEPITGRVKLRAVQFSTRNDNGRLWSYCVFKISTSLLAENKDQEPDSSGHDSDMKPPEPPIP